MSEFVKTRKKLIEVALPLEAINAASAREKSIRHGHPSTLHLWWARRPLAAARAVIFSQMVDDPSSVPELFPTEEGQEQERQRLFKLIEELVKWENTTNEIVLNQARQEIWKSWRRACVDNKDHSQAEKLFNPEKLPAFHDPFAGGGALPLEAQRLGLEAYASDLNPVAVLINKAMIEIPPKFASRPPVNPESRKQGVMPHKQWRGAEGLAEDVRYYGKWMRNEADKRIGHLYPKIHITMEMAKDRPDLKDLVGRSLTVVAWIWARTVKSPNPAFASLHVPLASTFMLCSKPGKEAYVDAIVGNDNYHFVVKVGKPRNPEKAKNGTKLARGANFECIMSGTPILGDYIKAEGGAGRMGARLMAIVAEGNRGRIYLSPTRSMEVAAISARPVWKPEGAMVEDARAFTPFLYGIRGWGDLFTDRQLLSLTTFSDLVSEAMDLVRDDAIASGLPADGKKLAENGYGALAYSQAIAVYLSCGVSRLANRLSTICIWNRIGEKIEQVFKMQLIQMTWDFVEANVFSDSTGGWSGSLEWIPSALETLPVHGSGISIQQDASTQSISDAKVTSTDPPYYDNVPYADLSDFFYLWLRRSLSSLYPDLFSTIAVPKGQELVATPYRHGGKEKAEIFFLEGMTDAMRRLADRAHPAFPITIYYAFKQSETEREAGTTSTGWETFLDAAIRAGFAISGTLPIKTERGGGVRNVARNSLASSIVLVCRQRPSTAPKTTHREFIATLKSELPAALAQLQRGNIAPVDLAQAMIGPGMGIYTRFAKVVASEGKAVSVHEALAFINQILDEILAAQEADFDGDTRWALAWFEQFGFAEGDYGTAETLSKAKNTSVQGLKDAGILDKRSPRGKVRLVRPDELPAKWDPVQHSRLTAWEVVHHLVHRLTKGGEISAAELVSVLGAIADVARELAYRLYSICERKKRAQEALPYNALVQSWPEIILLAREHAKAQPQPKQAEMYV
jgi:putative DNA methylase